MGPPSTGSPTGIQFHGASPASRPSRGSGQSCIGINFVIRKSSVHEHPALFSFRIQLVEVRPPLFRQRDRLGFQLGKFIDRERLIGLGPFDVLLQLFFRAHTDDGQGW